VIPGVQNAIPAKIFEFLPRRLLLPLLKSQHPALRK
ncbi:oxidoreductase, partial [Mycobacterium sp. ITM-2017-0098]